MDISSMVKVIGMIPDDNTIKYQDIGYNGLFNQIVKVEVDGVEFTSETLDIEFESPFDDDLITDETEIIIYNLAPSSSNRFIKGKTVTLSVGFSVQTLSTNNNYYNVGVICKGTIKKVKNQIKKPDRITTIYINPCSKVTDHTATITYGANSSAKGILLDILNRTGLPKGYINIPDNLNRVYEDETTIENSMLEGIKQYAQVLNVSTYVRNGALYCHRLGKDAINYWSTVTLSEETGLIGTPEAFLEDVRINGVEYSISGYNVECLARSPIGTATKVILDSQEVKGSFIVKEGEHSFNGTDLITIAKLVPCI